MTHAASNPYTAPTEFGAPAVEDLAGLGDRFLARVVDNVAGMATLTPGVLGVAGMTYVGGPEAAENPVATGIMVVGMLLTFALMIGLAVLQCVWLANRGQSVGKRVIGIHIVKVDGSPADFVTAVLLRAWVPGFVIGVANQMCLGWAVVLADVLPIFGQDRRCIHDHIAGTQVVAGYPAHLL